MLHRLATRGGKELTPQEFVQRMVHKIKLQLRELEAEFVDTVERTGGVDVLRLFEEFCIERVRCEGKGERPFW